MKYPFKKWQTNEYYALHCLESGCSQIGQMQPYLWDKAVTLNRSSLSSALQRLRKDGVVKYDGVWRIV